MGYGSQVGILLVVLAVLQVVGLALPREVRTPTLRGHSDAQIAVGAIPCFLVSVSAAWLLRASANFPNLHIFALYGAVNALGTTVSGFDVYPFARGLMWLNFGLYLFGALLAGWIIWSGIFALYKCMPGNRSSLGAWLVNVSVALAGLVHLVDDRMTSIVVFSLQSAILGAWFLHILWILGHFLKLAHDAAGASSGRDAEQAKLAFRTLLWFLGSTVLSCGTSSLLFAIYFYFVVVVL
jgi:hypothetical protein